MLTLLVREVLGLRGSISRGMPWEVMPDLFFYRDLEAVRRRRMRAGNEQVMKSGANFVPGEARTVAAAPVAPMSGYHVTEDWAASTETTNWATASSEQAAPNWGGSNQW